MKRRTNFNFDGYEHKQEHYLCGNKTIYVDTLHKGDFKCGRVVFTNTDDTLTVSGDFGNYVFCRPFIPTPDGFVSDMYWIEKLKMYSNQQFNELDKEENEKVIKDLLDGGLEKYGYKDNELSEAKVFFENLLEYIGDDLEYEYYAFRYDKPYFIDYDLIPYYKKMPVQLKIVFDAFEIICKKLRNN